MNIEIEEIFPFNKTRDISIIEELLKVKVPQEYIDFLNKYNGGMPTPYRFTINKDQGASNVSCFYGYTDKLSRDIIENSILFDNDYKETYIPIGVDPGGNKICICTSEGENYGKIYFWDHEVAPPKNLHLVANSFTEFLEKLY